MFKKKRKPDVDKMVVERAKAGDTAAFDELVKKYSPKIYGLVYNMTANHEDTNDLLQDIFSKAYRSLKRFRGKSSFYTWVYSIAVNTTLNFLKKRGRHYKMSLDDVDSGIHYDEEFLESTYIKNPREEVHIKELQKILNKALMKLSERHRTVVTMHDIQGIPHTEIGKILGVSPGTIRSRLFYAHKELQGYLAEYKK